MILNLAVLAYSGFWNCDACERPSEPREDDPGVAFPTCIHCGNKKLRWIPPANKPEALSNERASFS